MADDSFSKAIAWLGEQQQEENRRRETSRADLLTTFVLTFHQEGVLHIEGIPLDATKLAFLEFLLQANSKSHSILKLELKRCDLGKTSTDVPGATMVARNSITTIQALTRLLQSLPNLQSVDLSCNHFENNSIAQVLGALSNHKLNEFSLEDNLLQGQEGGRMIRSFLGSHPKLTYLNLSENALTARGTLEVAAGLCEHGRIEDLDIACCEIARDDGTVWNSFGRSAFEVLVDSLLENPNLQQLRLSVAESGMDERFIFSMNGPQNEFSPLPSESGTLAIVRLLEEHPALESLSVIQSPGFLCPDSSPALNERFAEALGNNRTIDRFALEGCGICDETVKLVFEKALQYNPVLKHLDLLSNDLGEQGHQYLNEALPRMKHLRSLLLEGATMDNPAEFAASLKRNTSLTYVQAIDTPDVDITSVIDEITHRNDTMHKANNLLDDYQNGNDQIWGDALASLARKPQGRSALFQVLSRKLWMPSSSSKTDSRPNKRPRFA